jgi:putative FmdB family regulatory protein
VPTYQYVCTECGGQIEAVQKFTDDPLTVHDECGGRLRKVFSPVGIVFKGSGFYRTDSRNGSSASSSADSAGPGGDKKAGDGDKKAGDGDKKAGDKAASSSSSSGSSSSSPDSSSSSSSSSPPNSSSSKGATGEKVA